MANKTNLTAALQHLTTKQQEVLYLRFYNQLSTKEIAEIMSVRPRTVYKLTRRAIMALQARLTPAPPVVEALMMLVFFYFMWHSGNIYIIPTPFFCCKCNY